MSEAQATPITKASLKLGEVFIEGKITDVTRPENSEYRYYTFSLKGEDEYSPPPVIQVSQPKGDTAFASKGDLIRIKASIGGYGRRNGGNLYIHNTLNFIEAF